MINLILGKSKTGKTTTVYQMIEEDINNGKNVILFVPSQSRYKAESEYMSMLNKAGVMGINITTVSEYVTNNIKSVHMHIDEKYISKLDKKVIITQVVNENLDIFKFFAKSRKYSGFLDMLTIYMDILRKSSISVEEYKKVVFEDKKIQLKFNEIISIYEKYMEKIREKYVDSVEEMDLFINDNAVNTKLRDSVIYFDEYNNFSNQEYKFIDKLMKLNLSITVTLNTDITKIEDTFISSGIFDEANQTYKKLCVLADKNNQNLENIIKVENLSLAKNDLKYLTDNIFTNEPEERIKLENVEIVVCTNVFKEVEKVAKQIVKKIEEGYLYSDFAIYTTNIDEYDKIMSRVFHENQLSLYTSKSKKIDESILTKYIIGVLNLAEKGMNLELIFELLKLGLTDIDLKYIYLLENYMKEFNVNQYLINRKFTLNNKSGEYDLEILNKIKDKVIKMFDFTKTLNNMTAKEYIKQVCIHLKENNVLDFYDKLINFSNKDSMDIDAANFEGQVWNGICSVFDSISKIYEDENINIKKYNEIFRLIIKDVKVKTLPPTKDQIELLDINVSKTEAKKQVFFIGVVENKFPKKVDQDMFFHDTELEKIQEKEIELKETTLSKLNMGLFNIYTAISNVIEKLYIYIPASNLDGKATRKSSIITSMSHVASFEISGEVSRIEESIENSLSKDEIFTWLVKEINNLKENDDIQKINKIVTLYEYYKNDEKYSKILNFKKDDSKLSDEITDILYREEFNSSISRLELYKKCPFSYYMQYILKVNPRQEVQVNRLEIGSFMHEVLEKFSKYLLKNKIKWEEILDEEDNLTKNYMDILNEIIDTEINTIFSKQKQSVRYSILKRKLSNTMKKVMSIIAKSYSQSEFEPYGYEIEFKDGEFLVPMEIVLDNEKRMKLIGKIDRIDVLELEDAMYARVIDYKSSSKKLSLEDIREGLSLQLISYLNAFIENNKDKNVKPAGMLYFNLSDKLIGLSQYEENSEKIEKKIVESLRMNGIFLKDIEILNKMDKNFENDNRFIGISKRSVSGNTSNTKNPSSLELSQFEKLCEEVKTILKDIGNEIVSGIVKIAPNKKADHCKFCNYSSVCRKNSCI